MNEAIENLGQFSSGDVEGPDADALYMGPRTISVPEAGSLARDRAQRQLRRCPSRRNPDDQDRSPAPGPGRGVAAKTGRIKPMRTAMNRYERRMRKVGEVIRATTIRAAMRDGTTALYWIVVPEGMTNEQAAETQEWHGPFKTDAEVLKSQRAVLLPPGCKVIHGGKWDPAWDKMQ